MDTLENKNKKWREEIEKFFVEENANREARTEHLSPSGKYKLLVTPYKTKNGCWNYTRGQVYKKKDDCDNCWFLIADVKQNYSHFPFGWAEGHPNGHDYLLCSENYQGQTVVELDTGKRIDFLPSQAHEGVGFCWVGRLPSPDMKMLAVEGCFWACPYEIVLYDFSDPMNLPYKQLLRADMYSDTSLHGWSDKNEMMLVKTRTIHTPTNQYLDEMTSQDMDNLMDCACYSDPNSDHEKDEEWEACVSTSDLLSNTIKWNKKTV